MKNFENKKIKNIGKKRKKKIHSFFIKFLEILIIKYLLTNFPYFFHGKFS